MNNARRYPNGIALPEGKVLITGGTKRGNNNGADSVVAVEMWNPASNTWTVGASAAHYRGYHSFSILLPSGVVLSTEAQQLATCIGWRMCATALSGSSRARCSSCLALRPDRTLLDLRRVRRRAGCVSGLFYGISPR